MGYFDGSSPRIIIGEVSSTAPNTIRTYVSKTDISVGEPVQLDRSELLDARYIKPFDPVLPAIREPILGVVAYDSSNTGLSYRTDRTVIGNFYKAGSPIPVLTYGDIRVHVAIGTVVYPGNQVFLKLKTIPPDYPEQSPYAFSDSQVTSGITYGTFVDGGIAPIGTESFIINFDAFGNNIPLTPPPET